MARFPRMRTRRRTFDQVTASEAFRRPGIDPRQWVTFGLVTPGREGDEVVVFDEEFGTPLVSVSLQPSKQPVRARVSSFCAGNGEAEWFPFVEGDEVIVAIPNGNERESVIIGRLNNGVDKFPMESVAGQDPTTNAFAFRRTRTPYIEERNGPILFRSAVSGAMFSIDTAGVVTIKDGENSALQISPDVIGFQGPSDAETPPEFLLQLNLSGRHATIQVGDALFNLSASDATPSAKSQVNVPTSFSIGSGGNAPLEHACSIENVVNLLMTMLINATIFPGLGGVTAAADLELAASITAAVSSGAWSSAPLSRAALAAALLIQPQKQALPTTELLQLTPGIAAASTLIG